MYHALHKSQQNQVRNVISDKNSRASAVYLAEIAVSAHWPTVHDSSDLQIVSICGRLVAHMQFCYH